MHIDICLITFGELPTYPGNGEELWYSQIQEWRKEHERKLASPDGWLAISGLFWLDEGKNRFGCAQPNEIVLPSGAAPDLAGVFSFKQGEISLKVNDGINLTINDKPVTSTKIKLNEFGSSDWLVLNELKLSVIQRGSRYGVRVYDPNNPPRRRFASLRWFPVEDAYSIKARYLAYDPPDTLMINNVLGDTLELTCPGYVEFSLNQQPCRLYPISDEDDDVLWFMFRDSTSGSLTYAGGRYLFVEPPTDETIVLDFNKAQNPPCSYTDFATCPLPPPQNKLSVPIMAGEMKF